MEPKTTIQEKIMVEDSFETGTSLAEQEYGAESAPPKGGEAHKVNDCVKTSYYETLMALHNLRSEIASDGVLLNNEGHSHLTFTSPFEVPRGAAVQNTTSRYLQVPMVYCDQTASNRPVQSIEKYLEETCLPYYGNTHTNTSVTGAQSTALVAEARQIVAEETNARITGKASLDVVLFAGSGTTAAVELLIDCLGLKHACEDADKRPVVFVGPYEHHSNLIPWRESGCEIVIVPECPKTLTVDHNALEKLLQKPIYNDRLKMGTFTAASNVTGNVSDVDQISATLHRHGALAFFDYATGAPYMSMDMNPSPSEKYPTPSLVSKDAIFFSPHKMIGGVGTPGVLVLKKNLVNQVNAPSRSGGGTVFYVTNTHHRFLSNRIERYEGGTPNVVGILRVGLAFLYKRKVEQKYAKLQRDQEQNNNDESIERIPLTLQRYEYSTYKHVASYLREHAPNLLLLGDHQGENSDSPHLPIFSFLIKCGSRFLHYNYVCAILNDVFGIQSRGGCQCSGPYSQRLLGLTTMTKDGGEVPNDRNEQIEQALVHLKERAELLRPGYTRLSLPFKGLRSEEVEYVLKALSWTAKNGWALMCNYRCNHRTGEWRHFNRQGKPLGREERKWLSHYDLPSDAFTRPSTSAVKQLGLADDLENALSNADCLLAAAKLDQRSISQALKMNDANIASGNDLELSEDLRWYLHPKECASYLSQGLLSVPGTESSEIMGAIQPTLCQPEAMEITPCASPDCAEPVGDVQMTEENGLADKKRKQTNTNMQSSCSVSFEANNTLQASANVSDDEHFIFRDGEHTGEASFTDIAAGFDDDELSGNCEVFDSKTDSWIGIESFLRTRKKSKTAFGKNKATSEPTAAFPAVVETFAFRDGEHVRQAPFAEIESGFDEGELSEMCEVFYSKVDAWVGIESFLKARKETPEATAPDKGVAGNLPGVPLPDEKNEKKKPARGTAAWGRGEFVFPKTTTSNGALSIPMSLPAKPDTVPNASESQNAPAPAKKKKFKHVKPPSKLMRQVTQAIMQWEMIEEGDRLLLGLSGGKDSLSLLHCLLEAKRKLPTNFEIEVCTIDPMTPSFDPSPLIPYVESLGLKYHYIRDDIVDRANNSGKEGKTVSSLCAFCARMKRGNLYTCARKNNCNKLVLAQHLDDCAESFMMSVMHNGFLRTMKANYRINAGDLSVIRPMVYCRESLMTEFAKSAQLPVINENCPACFEEPKERARIKKLLSREESIYPNFYDNIRRSIVPLMHDDLTAILHSYTEETVSKSRKVPHAGKRKPHQQAAKSIGSSTTTPNSAPRETLAVPTKDLSTASEEELLMALTKKRAEKFRLAGAMGRQGDETDPTGMVCTLNGGNGTIPCRELME